MISASDYLWKQLGVAPTTDEGAIRRAYARRLREVRPDDDPEGFQRLVEARDLALRLARRDAGRETHRSERTVELAAAAQGLAQAAEGGIRPAPRRIDPPGAVESRPDGRDRTTVLELLDAVLRESSDAGAHLWLTGRAVPRGPSEARWQDIVERIARLSILDRSAIQPDLIRRLSRYATDPPSEFRDWQVLRGYPTDRPPEFGDWPPATWPFFDLVSKLDAEFGWRKQDRIVHDVLSRGEADRFISLLAWAHDLTDAGQHDSTAHEAGHLPRVAAIDLCAFYDGGRDGVGLNAYRMMRDNPDLWRASDGATDLFFPLWSLRDGRYLTAIQGLLGWVGLILAFAPWRSPSIAHALPWIVPEAGSVLDALLDLSPLYLGLWIMVGAQNWENWEWRLKKRYSFFGVHTATRKAAELPVDLDASILFPFWAFGRGLYLRGVIGVLAWGAILHQIITMGPALFGDMRSHPGALVLVVFLHGTAGSFGQRWVVYKLLRTIAAADRAGLNDRAERWLYIRQRRTRNPRILRKLGKALAVLAVSLLAIAMFVMIFGAIRALIEGCWRCY